MEGKIARNEMREIITSMFGGGALFATLALIKVFTQKKICLDLHVNTPNLSKNDHALLVFLGELNREFYSLDPVACDRIALCGEDIIKLRLNPTRNTKQDAYNIYKIYQLNMQRILDVKKNVSTNTKNILKKIDSQFKSHLEYIMASHSDK